MVRPKGIQSDALVNDSIGQSEDGEMEEGRVIGGQKIVYQPSQPEWDDHMRIHIPFRKWCPYCVQGTRVSGAHKKRVKSDEEIELETREISWDYMGPKSKNDKSHKMDSLPILVGIDRRPKWITAHMVPTKGPDAQSNQNGQQRNQIVRILEDDYEI